MRLLDRYLLRELLIPLGYCLGGFLILWISFDIFAGLDEFQHEKLSIIDLARYYVAKLPEMLVIVMPVALLLGLLYALTNHARHQELTAMRAAGVSLWRLCAPYLGVGLFFSLILYLLNEHWASDSGEAAEQIRKSLISGQAQRAQPWQYDLKFRNDAAERFWLIRAYNVETGEMRDPYVEWKRPDGSRWQLFAEQAVRTNGAWTFYNVRQSIPASTPDSVVLWQPTTNELTVVEFSETPEQIKSEIKVSRLSSIKAAKRVQLSIAEIRDYKRLHPFLRPRVRALLDTQLHTRLAEKITCLVVVLIAIPFGAPSGRRNVFVGVAASIFIAFTYFVVQRFGMALGTGGFVPPLLAAWLPNLLFGATGLWLTARVR